MNSQLKLYGNAFLFCFLFTAIYVLVYFFVSPIYSEPSRPFHAFVGCLVAFGISYVFIKQDRRSWKEIGVSLQSSSIPNFLKGVLFGIFIMGTLVLAVVLFSSFSIHTNTNASLLNFLLSTAVLLPLAYMEELAFRGYPLLILKEGTSTRIALVSTSILFALYHIANNWTFQTAFLGAGVWGVVYGIAALYSKGLAMPTGLHYAANLTTSAFSVKSGGAALWVLTTKSGSSLEEYQASELETLLQQLGLLIFAILVMESYIRFERNKLQH
ncbi:MULTISPECIES: CPBP family intramembrane glutamic endopeptidase [unclassified Paraflavitalea]|uniref:CPBP family intramembrane glutamic endopeptidase n=1 Tax=unclassified Paraflavitalea TaxID=2798305 RepID=UPI003D3471D0